MKTIREAIAIVGSVRKLAKLLEVQRQTVYYWLTGSSQIRACDASKIEIVTNGKVKAFDIGMEFAKLKEAA